MTPRIEQELELLRKKFPGVVPKDEQTRVILVFPDYRLPSGWIRLTTELSIVVPPGYPITPPDNFYVRPALRTSADLPPASYTDDATSQGMPGWSWFSFHMQDSANKSSWSPANDIERGDNLLTYMRAVGERLREAN